MIQDRNIAWRRKKIYIPWKEFSGIAVVLETGATAELPFKTSADADVVATELGTLEMHGLKMENAAEVVNHHFRTPYDMNADKAIGFKVNWTSASATAADTVTWKVFCNFVKIDVILAVATGVLDTVIVADNVTGINFNQWTARGIKTNSGLVQADIDNGAWMVLQVEMDAKVTITEDIFFCGLEIDYYPLLANAAADGVDKNL